jgi:hypothetical protein
MYMGSVSGNQLMIDTLNRVLSTLGKTGLATGIVKPIPLIHTVKR